MTWFQARPYRCKATLDLRVLVRSSKFQRGVFVWRTPFLIFWWDVSCPRWRSSFQRRKFWSHSITWTKISIFIRQLLHFSIDLIFLSVKKKILFRKEGIRINRLAVDFNLWFYTCRASKSGPEQHSLAADHANEKPWTCPLWWPPLPAIKPVLFPTAYECSIRGAVLTRAYPVRRAIGSVSKHYIWLFASHVRLSLPHSSFSPLLHIYCRKSILEKRRWTWFGRDRLL